MNLGWSLCVEKLMKYRAAREGPASARDHRRDGPHRQPPGRHGRLRPRPRHVQPVSVRLPRAGKNSRPVRGSVRRPAHLQLPHRRRRDGRPAAAAGCRSARRSSTSSSRSSQEYHTLLTTNAIFVKRTAGIGVLSPEMAIDYGTSGPVLRGSGVDHDLRRDGEEIYTAMYDGYAFEVICRAQRPLSEGPRLSAGAARGGAGRLLAPVLRADAGSGAVRSTSCGRRSIATAGDRQLRRADQAQPEAAQGRVLSGNRVPRGPDGLLHRVSNGEAIPWRARARSSCFCNLSVTDALCRGCLIADVPAIVGSLDIVMGEIDR